MWIADLLALGVLAVFVIMGAVRGTFAGVVRTSTLVLSYLSGFVGAKLFGPIAEILGYNPLLAGAGAGVACFGFVFLMLSFGGWLATRWEKARRDGMPRTGLDRMGGGMIGSIQGVLIVLLLGVAVNWLESAAAFENPEAEADRSMLSGITETVVSAGADLVLEDDTQGRITRLLVVNPGQTMTGLRDVIDHPRIQALQQDTLFWQYVTTGAVDSALNRGSFLGISYDPELRGQLVDLGLMPPEARANSKVFRERAREVLAEVGPRVRSIQNDPALEKLANDPAIQAAIESGDTLALLRNKDLRDLIGRAMRAGPDSSAQAPDSDQAATDGSGEYRDTSYPGR